MNEEEVFSNLPPDVREEARRVAKKNVKNIYDIHYQFSSNGCIHKKCGLPIDLCDCEDAPFKVSYPDPRPE